ncbi:alpha/beta hydrolase [Verticiella sediminum]|uniref:Alpha/beta hydrolase n=1 Tax=Verticiella sediminum TaxID=1247510 RepID=A0A556B1Y5_9BURK|nr:alpha/beta hydrolase [Verticiella sediminum]TSH99170.1 alpha/beta hydrolase [Verticiella sediminum]
MTHPLPLQDAPAALRELMARLGPRWHQDIRAASAEAKAAYAPLLAAVDNSHAEVLRDVAYGEHPRQTLDVFVPKAVKPGAPVIAFVHGGAFMRGDKSGPQGMFDNVLYWFARHGFVGVNIEYRLAPEAMYPDAVHDVAAAVQWMHTHIAEHGGDPARMSLLGHSAGGTHVASYVFDSGVGYLGRHLAANILVSARLRADRSPENPNAGGVSSYFGDDFSVYERHSPMLFAHCSPLPTFVVTAEFENPLLDIYGLEFAHRLAVARRVAPRFLQLPRHNHASIMAHFNSGEEILGTHILDFLREAGAA